MATPNPIPPPAPTGPAGWNPQKHGNLAQWVAPVVTLIIGICSVSTVIHYRNVDSSSKTSDEHVDGRIDAKLNPALDKLNGNFDKKLDPINRQLEELNRTVGQIQGKLGIFATNQKKLSSRVDQQTSLAKLMDPTRILGTIRAEIQLAETNKNPNASTLADYKNAILAVPNSAQEYWATVAAIINYQSLIDQLSGEAPDPAKVAKPCALLTGPGSSHNYISGGISASDCIVDLDTNQLSNLVIRDSVVRYHGGNVALHNVTFINCRFVIELANPSQPPVQPNFLLALLNANLLKMRISVRG